MNASKSDSYQLGIIGYPLTHTFSPTYFNEKFQALGVEAHYEVWELPDISMVTALRSLKRLKGFNVTIPYKSAILPFLDNLDIHAKAIGAVNCVVVDEGKWTGHNTDIIGFEMSLRALLKNISSHDLHKLKALILGTGGAAKAVAYVLDLLDISYQNVTRNTNGSHINYIKLTHNVIREHRLIINTTPIGLYPNTEVLPPIPYERIGAGHYLFDLIYNPSQTAFLKQGAIQGAQIMNGHQMLVDQAEANWRLWFGKTL